MAEGNEKAPPRAWLWRHVWVGVVICVVLLIIFHKPILLAIVRQIATGLASKQNLKVDFRLEGEPLSYLTVRNLHAVPTGPSGIESIDIDSVYLDYSLPGFVQHGLSRFLQDVELRGAEIVLNLSRAPPPKPHPKKKPTLPSAFPERIRLADVTLIIRGSPNDFVVEHADLDLNPRAPGELRIEKLQLPSGDVWSKLAGQTSYANRNFILRNLVLSNQEQVRLLQIDASGIDSKALAVKLDAAVGGGQLSASAALNQTESSLDAKVNVAAEKIAAGSLNKFLLLPENYFSGEIERLALDGAGMIDAPHTWNGTLSLRITGVHGPVNVDTGVVEVSAGQGKATVQSAEIIQDQNEVHLRGTMELPATVENFWRTPTSLQISGQAPDLEQLTAQTLLQLTGAIQFNGAIDIVNQSLDVVLRVAGEQVGFPDGIVDKLNATVRASKNVGRGDSKRPWFANLRTAMEFTLTGIRYRDYIVDSVNGSVNGSDDVLGLDKITLRRNQNELSIRGRYWLPDHFGSALSQPVQLDVAANAPQVGECWVADSPDKISGSLHTTAQIERKQRIIDGQVSISGSNLRVRDLIVRQVSAQVSITNNVIHLNECGVTLNDTDYVNATGTFNLQPPHHYNGGVSASVSNLAVLEPLLRASGNQRQLAGSLKLDWDGSGDAQAFKNTGNLKFVLEKARYGNLQGLQANIEASYSPDGLDVPIIFFATNNIDFQAIARTKDNRLEIDKLQLDQVATDRQGVRGGALRERALPAGRTQFAWGYVSIPFVWSKLGTSSPVIPSSGKVSATVQVENLDLKKLAENLGIKSTVSGTFNARLDAGGTVADLNAQLGVRMQELRNEQWPKMEPASFELTAQVAHNRLEASGKLQQARIQPLETRVSMPFDLAKIVRARGLPANTPISAKARLPRSSVNFVRQFVPEIERLDGSVAMDVDVRGTIENPVFNGAADMTVNVARFTNSALPTLRNLKAELAFAKNTLSLQRFGGELAGGSLMASGRIAFPKLTKPTLDLRLKANSALVARNDTLTLRADADLGITGPLASAVVTGNVALTDSHILKNIELIPIGLPGRPPPHTFSSAPELSITTPPLRDWNFNVAIKTKNPVEIRGNLATGGATVDLKLRGTGLHPGLQGVVQMQNVEATLPFSRLNVSQGLLTFDPGDSMNPKISLQGASVIRDYTVRVYVYGTVESPQAIFSSEPPLPQEEIISLIATGATRQELSGTNVLAGRAATLLVQELYRKIVKKGQPTQSNTFFNRLDLDLGTVDPRTGQQQATVRFKIDDHLVLTGDVGVRGDFRGRLKYLIRFR